MSPQATAGLVTTDRLNTSVDPGAWNAVGAWGYKATQSGGWNYQIGADGCNFNASELPFTTTAPNQEVDMFLNAMNGTTSLNVIPVPEPTMVALLGLGRLVLVQRTLRRRK